MRIYHRSKIGDREVFNSAPIMESGQIEHVLSEIAYQNTAIIELNRLIADRISQPGVHGFTDACPEEEAA